MNNLLFTALCLALLYYLFYRPQPNIANRPFKHQQTQTEIDETPEIIKQLKEDNHQKAIIIIGLNNSYEKLETKNSREIESLKEDLTASRKANQKLLELASQVNQDEKVFSQLKKEMEELTRKLN